MSDSVTNITAVWSDGTGVNRLISRQYDNNAFRITFGGAPEGDDYIYHLLVWMKTSEDQEKPVQLPAILLDSNQWLISNYYTQLEQVICFQLYVHDSNDSFVAHSPIYAGTIANSLEHDGDSVEIDTDGLYDPYIEYVNSLIVAAGAVVIDSTLSTSGAAADAKATGDAISTINAQISSLSAMSFELVVDDETGVVTIERSDLVDTSEVSY